MKSITYSEKLEVRFRLENTKKLCLYKINLVLTYKISIMLGNMNRDVREILDQALDLEEYQRKQIAAFLVLSTLSSISANEVRDRNIMKK
jgi:hypothetical protein